MAISYNGLWKQLIDHGMKKGDLCAKTGLSSSTIAKMTNCESVKLSVLEKIWLNHKFCGISDSSRSSVGSYRIASERNIRHQDIRIPVCEES